MTPGSPDRDWLAPQLATLAKAAPDGDDWIHEIKFDGYRLLAWIDGGRVRLMTRNRKDWTDRFPQVESALAALGVRDSVWDGELAVELANGATSFQALQNALTDPTRGTLRFFLFDVLRHSGSDVRRRPLLERKELLRAALPEAGGVLRYSDHVRGEGPAFFRAACELDLEGIISKRAAAPYRAGRGSDWLKVKCVRVQEFVVGGFTEPSGSRAGIGALHVGAYEGGRLIYRGKVGTGFTDAVLRDLRRRLEPLERVESPFVDAPRGAAGRAARWVKPVLVAQVRFTEMTGDGRLRHPSFEGLRQDKDARDVTLEQPIADSPSGEVMTKSTGAKKKAGNGSRKASAGSHETTAAKKSKKPAKKTAGKPAKAGAAVQVGDVRLTSPGKVLYPEQGLTKLDLAEYYQTVADWILPHISGRPLTLVRCPSGRAGWCFFQKHIDDSAPPAIHRVEVEEKDGPELYGVVDDVDGLVSLAQIGALELHTFNVRQDQLERPDRFLIDLDPDEDIGWDLIVEAAVHVRDLLAELGLASFVKTTGGKGLHVVVPLVRRADWEEVRQFSKAVASLLASAAPDRYTLDMSKKKRKGRVLLDYMRNTRGATAIEAYSTRARPGAPVAVPITWDELENDVRSDTFNVRNVPERLAGLREDPWKEMAAVRQSLTAAMKRRLGL
ncbi:MAG TPA: DNA ligase D [Longimicrobiales bacterium]|nr:DNA ligase D [Longimicrobiales bacterium]